MTDPAYADYDTATWPSHVTYVDEGITYEDFLVEDADKVDSGYDCMDCFEEYYGEEPSPDAHAIVRHDVFFESSWEGQGNVYRWACPRHARMLWAKSKILRTNMPIRLTPTTYIDTDGEWKSG